MKKSSIDALLTVSPPKQKDLPTNEDLTKLDLDDLIEEFHNALAAFGRRKQAYNEIIKRNPDLGREHVTNICRNLEHTGSKDLQGFMLFMLDYVPMDIFMKFECSLALLGSNYTGVRAYFLAILRDYSILPKETRPSIIIYIDVLRYLIQTGSPESKEDSFLVDDAIVRLQVDWLLKESGLSPDFLYKTILSMQRDKERRVSESYLDYLYITYFNCIIDSAPHTILCAQYLLQKKPKSCDLAHVEDILFSIATNITTSYNVKADSADVLVRLGSSSAQKKGKKIITELGKDIGRLSTVYSNRQNVHDQEIEESVKKFLLDLGGISVEGALSFDEIVEKLRTQVKDSPKYASDIGKVDGSLLRIKIDQILYPGSQSLATVFVRIYSMICKHVNAETLSDRLIEELIDMDSTCSSGHASRLVNVFAGIDGFNLRIGFKSQIQSNIAARVQKAIREITDEEMQEKLLNEMTTEEHFDKPNFLTFLKNIIGNIHEELFREFVPTYLDDQEFELHFRDGVTFFETGVRMD